LLFCSGSHDANMSAWATSELISEEDVSVRSPTVPPLTPATRTAHVATHSITSAHTHRRRHDADIRIVGQRRQQKGRALRETVGDHARE
jgi:hypothetical protein